MNLSLLNLLALPHKDGVRRSYLGQKFSKMPGNSEERASPTEYVYGDNLRKADWNAYAKTGVLHVHRSLAYNPLQVRLVYNDSPGMLYGTGISKNEVQLTAYKSLSYIGMRDNAEITLENESWSSRLKARDLENLEKLLQPTEWDSAPTYDATMSKLAHSCADSLIVFAADIRTSDKTLSLLRTLSMNNLLCVLLIVDRSELFMNSAGTLRFQDPLTGRIGTYNSSSRSLVRDYNELAVKEYYGIRDRLLDMGAFLIELDTTSQVDNVLGSRLPRRI